MKTKSQSKKTWTAPELKSIGVKEFKSGGQTSSPVENSTYSS